MKVHYGFDDLPHFRHPAATVGSYDGVHQGHRILLARTVREACAAGGESIVLTFEPHPRVTLGCAEGLRLLTTTQEKALLLEREGVDHLVVVPFDAAFSHLVPDRFVRDYLIGRVGVETLVVGYNHHFGYGKEGDYAYLDRLRAEYGFRVVREAEYADAGKVSSTVLRGLVERGEMARAARLLGHSYLLIGQADGREVRVAEPLKLLPPPGRYLVTIGGRVSRCAKEADREDPAPSTDCLRERKKVSATGSAEPAEINEGKAELTVRADGTLLLDRSLRAGIVVLSFES